MTTLTIPTTRPEMKSYMNRGKPSGTSTPWGTADMQRCFAPGFIQVGTPSHGGLGITATFAKKAGITDQALKRAILHSGRYWFEEDCRFAIIFWELGPAWWAVLFGANGFESSPDGGTALVDASNYTGKNPVMGRMSVRQYLRQTISAWDADYFLESGAPHELTQKEYDSWLARKTDERLRREKSPELIVSAMSKGYQEPYGEKVILVATADGKYHVVRDGTYTVSTPNYLANCDILDGDVEMRFY